MADGARYQPRGRGPDRPPDRQHELDQRQSSAEDLPPRRRPRRDDEFVIEPRGPMLPGDGEVGWRARPMLNLARSASTELYNQINAEPQQIRRHVNQHQRSARSTSQGQVAPEQARAKTAGKAFDTSDIHETRYLPYRRDLTAQQHRETLPGQRPASRHVSFGEHKVINGAVDYPNNHGHSHRRASSAERRAHPAYDRFHDVRKEAADQSKALEQMPTSVWPKWIPARFRRGQYAPSYRVVEEPVHQERERSRAKDPVKFHLPRYCSVSFCHLCSSIYLTHVVPFKSRFLFIWLIFA